MCASPLHHQEEEIKRQSVRHYHALLMLLVIDLDKAMRHGREARPRVSFSTEKYLIPVEETDPVVKLIVGFAVDAFNDFYHKSMEAEYHQSCTLWETGEEILRRDMRSFHQESEYRLSVFPVDVSCRIGIPLAKHAWSSDESEPEDFYEISGMVHRMATSGGGFDYHNPSSTFHRYVGA
ncbi:hypothetical protein Tco_1284007 [Tanacetum coccineum]